MLRLVKWRGTVRRAGLVTGLCGTFGAAWLVAALAASDQPVGDAVGLIEGDDIAVTGPMSVEVFAGQTKTILHSGSDVRVKSGQARISLVEGGQVSVCGPAHFSVLKSGGSLTIALESGIMHALIEREPALTVYTAQIQAQPVAIGDEPSDLLVGFASPGLMCIRPYRGAMRLEQQLTGQSVIVPQGGDLLLTNGQFDSLTSGGEHCQCELQIAKVAPLPAPAVSPAAQASNDASKPATTAETVTAQTIQPPSDPPSAVEKAAAPPKDETIYQVAMPPLVFDAKAKVQPETDPRLMVIVSRVRVRPELVFRGRVESEPVATAATSQTPPPPVAAPNATTNPPQPPEGSVTDRVRSFFRRLWAKSL